MGKNNLEVYSINEQQTFPCYQIEKLKELKLDPPQNDKDVRYLGLDPNNFSVKFYIGIDWLQENKNYIVVHPKIENLDYVRMFIHCLHHPEISPFLKDVYHFDFTKTNIKPETIEWELTPFMLVHFLSLIDKIVTQGLKKNYTVIEENLNSKVKGKIIWPRQIKKNIAGKREDRAYCRYQEYSVDCWENRLLKKALLFVERYSTKYLKQYPDFIRKQNRLLSAFDNVSQDISYSEIKRVKVNSLYKEYVEAIELAKQILRRFGYSFKKADDKTIDKELPPFWIDMSKLFELYVYSLLSDQYGKAILYQPHGEYGYVDFLKKDNNQDGKLIIDTKYKTDYDNNRYEIEDIRQLSAYARDRGVLNKLSIDSDKVVVNCVIIYPTEDEKQKDFKHRDLKCKPIDGFTRFYKCGIKLPIK
ncbi:MAG: McrC family protein [Prevotellaceae bacterium]|jgi:5-methylcytosine-specific restriction enzyme subunit McrC|nr:McrC family protein [Prevotellaceae bacterium]